MRHRGSFRNSLLLSAAIASLLPHPHILKPDQPSLTITSEPGSTVWIDDIRFGKTDASGKFVVKDLGGTRHNVRVRSDGFKETSKAIASAQGDVNIPLIKTTDPAELAFQQAEGFWIPRSAKGDRRLSKCH